MISPSQSTQKHKRQSLSLCMIVRNEEQNLSECLDSVKNVVDEIIVIDTGSTDETVGIAESYGAQVEHFPWCDDFSKARNESIKYASGDWILWLDADERLLPESIPVLQDLLRPVKNPRCTRSIFAT